jgi:hypothetical protein
MVFGFSANMFAGNPDRQGEAGAYELMLNPWARSAGLHTLTTSMTTGVDAMRINPAGVSRINSTQFMVSHARYLQGSTVNMNAIGLAQKMGENGAIGISLMAMDFGDILVTTVDQPEGDGTTFSPSFFNIGLSYSHTFENKVSVGILVRGISESIASISAFGLALDAGVQYVTGPKDNFKFGVSLRNIGGAMRFGGEGLSFQGESPNNNLSYEFTANQRAAKFELPSMLNIGLSYDFYAAESLRLTAIGNFTANSFARDIVGAGVEFSFRELFFLRGAYRVEMNTGDETIGPSAYTGLSAGAGVYVDVSRNNDTQFQIDYAYRASNPFAGTHNISVTFDL